LGDSNPDEINQMEKQTHLITNHHAVADEEGNPICDSFRIITHPNSQNLANLQYYDVELKDDSGSSCWLEHPEGSEIDVVAIPLEIDLSDSGTRVISNQLRIPDNIEVTFDQEAAYAIPSGERHHISRLPETQ
jgi:hypothetical protein